MMSKEYEVGYALHRCRMDIMDNILRVSNEGARKTHIMYKCNLSFKQLNTYLDLLVSIRLLKSVPPRTEEKSDSNTYETTEKGQDFVQAYRKLRDLFATR
jgi:predicted transcriptional regulator